MGILKFRLRPDELARVRPELRKMYMTGLDRTPERVSVDVRQGLMFCQREAPESGRLHLPWPVQGFGVPYVATATLTERGTPYDLTVELSRGKLFEVRTQAAEWTQMGLRVPPLAAAALDEARQAFARAVTSEPGSERAETQAASCLEAAFRAGQALAEAYTDQVLRKRLEHSPRLHTLLGVGLNGDPTRAKWAAALPPACNAARIRCSWADLAPSEGQYRWNRVDAQLDWCQKHDVMPSAGPLLEFHPRALPDWLWLWQGDFESIEGLLLDLVRQAVARYKGKLGFWHLVGRPASSEILGLSEEEQIRLTAKVLQIARQADPSTPIVVDFDRPWGEWIGTGGFQLGPLHLADSLVRAELGLSGIGLEIAPGFAAPGSHRRDLFEFSRLLDLYALFGLPLHLTIALPSATEGDENASPEVTVAPDQWPQPPSADSQHDTAAAWIALAIAKPFVRSVTWHHATDTEPHLYPHAGLIGPGSIPKPVLAWLRKFRESHLL